MTDREPQSLCEQVLDHVGDRAEAVVTAVHGMAGLTRFANSFIHQNVAEEELTVGLKLAVDGRYASGETNQTDSEGLRRLVERIFDAARLRPPDPDWPGLSPQAPVADVTHWDEATAGASPDVRADIVRAFAEAGGGLEAAGYCTTSFNREAAANSLGQRVEGRHTFAELSGVHRTGTSDASASRTSVSVGDIDGAAAGEDAAQRARAGAETIDLEPGTYEVVLAPSCLANMLQFLAMYGFNGKQFVDGTSFVHLGEQQFDESVSLWDDATDPRTLGLLFDAELTPKRRVDLVTAGVSTSLVHDRRTAKRAGADSTGHGVGQDTFGAFPTNLFFGGGSSTVDELVGGVGRGLLVNDFWYTRILDPKTQVVTGLTRNGVFLIEDGKVGPAVANLRFTQSFVAALAPGKVKGIGNDGRLVGGMHVPTVHLAAWNFTGGAKG